MAPFAEMKAKIALSTARALMNEREYAKTAALLEKHGPPDDNHCLQWYALLAGCYTRLQDREKLLRLCLNVDTRCKNHWFKSKQKRDSELICSFIVYFLSCLSLLYKEGSEFSELFAFMLREVDPKLIAKFVARSFPSLTNVASSVILEKYLKTKDADLLSGLITLFQLQQNVIPDQWFTEIYPKIFLDATRAGEGVVFLWNTACMMRSFPHACHAFQFAKEQYVPMEGFPSAYDFKKGTAMMNGRCEFRICCKCSKVAERGAIKVCSRCRSFYYCSEECSRANWKWHKTLCVKGRSSKKGITGDS